MALVFKLRGATRQHRRPGPRLHLRSLPGLSDIRVNAGGGMGDKYVMVGKATYGGATRGLAGKLTSNGALDQSFAIGQSPVANVALFDAEVLNGGGGDNNSQFYCAAIFPMLSTVKILHSARPTLPGLITTGPWIPPGPVAPTAPSMPWMSRRLGRLSSRRLQPV